MKDFLKTNWFQIVVIILLVMCYTRLGEINDNTYYVADIVDSSTSSLINTFEDYLSDIESNTANIYYSI